MPLIIPTGACLARIRLTPLSQQPAVNLVGINAITPPNQDDVDDFFETISPAYAAKLSTVSSINGVDLLVGNGTSTPGLLVSAGASVPGTRGGAHCTQQVQGLLKKTTALSGRHNRGRLFLPDLLEANVDNNGVLNGTELALQQAVADAITSACTSGAFVAQLILHRNNSTPIDVTSFQTETKVATLRRRYPR